MFEILLVISIGFFLMLFFTSLLEKQHIQQFRAVNPDMLPPLSPYCLAMSQNAQELDFEPLGTFLQDRGSKAYAAIVSFWLSPDAQTLARIGGGKILGVSIRRTTLTSRFASGQMFETTDEFGTLDLSGLAERKIVMNAGLRELYACHRARLAAAQEEPQNFSRGGILAVYEEMELAKAERLEKLGLAKSVNMQHTIWRYTIRGAWQVYFKSYRAQLAAGKSQLERTKLKRPGD
jgi:hypothetical protein